jgi:hypothetical protein
MYNSDDLSLIIILLNTIPLQLTAFFHYNTQINNNTKSPATIVLSDSHKTNTKSPATTVLALGINPEIP